MSFTQVRDNRILQEEPSDEVYQVRKGANSAVYITRKFLNATPSSMSIVLPVCAKGVGRDRTHLYINCTGQIVLTGTNLSVANLNSGVVGWKPWPLNRNFSTVQHVIGNADETLNVSQLIDVLSNLNLTPNQSNYYSNSQPDFYADYNALSGTTLNPLSAYSSNVDGDTYKSRCLGITSVVVNDDGTQMTVGFNLIEPLMTPFTFLSTNDEPALFNIPAEQVNITSQNSMKDMLGIMTPKINGGGAAATITSQVVENFNADLFTCYISMDADEVSESSSIIFPSFQYQATNPSTKVVNNATVAGTPIVTNGTVTINYQNIFDKAIFVARQTWSDRKTTGAVASLPDRFLVLDKAQISLNNLPASLNGASKRALFDISKRNGYAGSFEHYSGQSLDYGAYRLIGSGSLLVVDPVLDLGLSSSGLSNDANANYTLTASFDIQNYLVGTNNVTPTLNNVELACIVMTKKELIRSGNSDYISRPFSISVADVGKVLDLDEKDAIPSSSVEQSDARMHGAGFGSFLSKAAKWGMSNKDKIFDTAKKGLDIVKKGKEFYDNVRGGYEMGGYEMGGSRANKKTLKLHKYK